MDYCCGLGNTTKNLYEYGAKKVYGIDIAEDELNTAKKAVENAGFDSSGLIVGDAENTPFEDNKFDLIVCIGVLHHLDCNKAFKEIYRILKPGGYVVAFEALGYNPIIQLYRNLTPHLRTPWEKDHILTNKELKIAKKYFNKNIQIKYFHLATLFSLPFTRLFFFKPLLGFLNFIDKIILKVPYLRLMAWQMVFTLKNNMIKINKFCIGGEQLGMIDWGNIDIKDLFSTFKYSILKGVDEVDTSNIYGLGKSEINISKFLSQIKNSNELKISTKVGLVPKESNGERAYSYKGLIRKNNF